MAVSAPAVAAGLLAGFVGFASSFAVVLQGLAAMGASPAQAASGLMALSIAMGVCGIALSLWRRMPISVAWSTPGAALLAASAMPAGGFPAAVGAFLVTGALIMLAGLWKPLGRGVAAIPAPLANAMLAGVLLGLCLAPVRAVAEAPAMGLAIVLAWAAVGRVNRLLAVPAAVLVAMGLIGATVALPPGLAAEAGPVPVWVAPEFSPAAILGVALPLFLVTMASQNIPGMAVLNANGYRPAPGPLFTVTGFFTLLGAPLGGHAVNLAAITAALCANPEAEPDPARRWQAAVVAGAAYVAFGLLAGTATAFVGAAPPVLIQAVAGLALLGAFGAALQAALAAPEGREAAVICFLVTASGLTVFGISGAFWGLLAGGGMMVLHRRS
ncbi:benzoate transporter [Siccirubricoccus deserti]|uniref:Benzoate/H(+) symporter BenE family transporter n=1 Tax=Siccirubricoccus deserti TaxID=2013562 RepID=A0A9X0R416_9PROT|nr:benzoate/H(+) symporter BenE family transporter [Siccirubricoccus deserti]MBC4017927.1 benzoate/H(+) symporter BenE family transporter [Siccirubricoccus deserti]GGC62143.1 benzoate transporter [Siccirubricoccus deserti]